MTFPSAFRRLALLVSFLAIFACGGSASAVPLTEIYINEVYIDPQPGSPPDSTSEYVEIRGTPNGDLSGIYFLIVENENAASSNSGTIDAIWNLGSYSLGSNGFLVGMQNNHPAGNYGNVAAGTTWLENTSGFGWGGASSTINFTNANGDGRIENSGGTYMIVDIGAGAAPTLNFDLDVDNNGLDNPSGMSGWTILDSIGIHGESDDAALGRLYGTVNFGFGPSTAIEPGAVYVDTDEAGIPATQKLNEIEYFARWGNSTGQNPSDWLVANLTDDIVGFDGSNFAIASDPPENYPQAHHGTTPRAVPSGTEVTNTFGSVNYPGVVIGTDGDLNDDGFVDDQDIDILWNVIRPELAGSDDPGADDDEDLNGDGFVNEDDVDYMLANLLDAGTNRQYGDADLDGGVGGLDYTAWRQRAGTGWANGDFDGDGGVGGLDYTLWRTRPTTYPTTVGPHPGNGGPQVVPEPATWVLLLVGAGGMLLRVRRRS